MLSRIWLAGVAVLLPLPGASAPTCAPAVTTPAGTITFGWSIGKIY